MHDLDLDTAIELLWRTAVVGGIEPRSLREAVGLVLGRDVISDTPFPPFDRITMDGYAVRAVDVAKASVQEPARLRVIGQVNAGAPFEGELGEGEALKAMTGGVLPAGADAVVKVEDSAGYDDRTALIHRPVSVGTNIAVRGEDLDTGDVVLARGTRIGAQHVQALAAAGCAQVDIVAPPSTAVLSTGSELVAADRVPRRGQIRESNSHAMVALLAAMGIEAVRLAPVADSPAELRERVGSALERHEVLCLSGGVSKGEKDYVKPVLRDCGVDLHFESLRLKPGHPAVFGSRQDQSGLQLIFALPGNPVSVFASLCCVVSAALRKRLGYQHARPRGRWAALGFDHHRRGDRSHLLPVQMCSPDVGGGLPVAHSCRAHGSGDFIALARANAFVELPAGKELFRKGESVRVHDLPGAWND